MVTSNALGASSPPPQAASKAAAVKADKAAEVDRARARRREFKSFEGNGMLSPGLVVPPTIETMRRRTGRRDDTEDGSLVGTIPRITAAAEPARVVSDMVRRSSWALALSATELETVLSEIQHRQIGAGRLVARSGELVEHWIGLVEGFAKMSVASPEGRISTLTGVGPGVWFGEGSLLKHECRRYDVVALRPSTIALLPRQTFEWLRRTSFPFNHYLQDLLNARLSLFIGTLESDRLEDTDARVAHGLASLFNPQLYPGTSRRVELGQREIGLLANVSRQRVNVALRRLQQLNLVRLEKRGLTVLDIEGLKAFAGVGL